MSKISRADVEHVADLARLALTGEEIETFGTQLNDILGFADQLQALDLRDVEPTAHAVPVKNVFRPDEARPSMPREKVLQNTPQEQNGYFRVPRIMDE